MGYTDRFVRVDPPEWAVTGSHRVDIDELLPEMYGDSWGDVGDVAAQVAENPGDLYYVDRCAPDHLARAWDLTPDEQRRAALPYLG